MLHAHSTFNLFAGKKIGIPHKLIWDHDFCFFKVENVVMGAVSSLSTDYLKGSGFLDNRVDACLLGCHLQHLIDALLSHIGTDVIGAALAKGILGNGRHAGIEVFIVALLIRASLKYTIADSSRAVSRSRLSAMP